MSDTQDIFRQSMDQMAALSQNWIKPAGTNMSVSANAEELTRLASDLQQLYAEACRCQVDPFIAGNQEIAERLAALAGSRNPQDFAEFQLEIMGIVMKGASTRADLWGELAGKIGHRYAEFIRAMSASMHSAPDTAATKVTNGSGAASRSASKPAK